jgi:hypothetical protein
MSPQDTALLGGIYYALGFRQVRFIDNIEVRMPTAEEAELMSRPGPQSASTPASVSTKTADASASSSTSGPVTARSSPTTCPSRNGACQPTEIPSVDLPRTRGR